MHLYIIKIYYFDKLLSIIVLVKFHQEMYYKNSCLKLIIYPILTFELYSLQILVIHIRQTSSPEIS